MNSTDVSVIVITYNRWDKLSNCLQCLEKQTVSGFEVVVVNDGSTDNTAEKLKDFNAQNFSLTVVNKPNEGRSDSRNRGAKDAKGSVLVFFDDDMRPEPGCVAAHLQMIEKNDDTISVGTQEEDLLQAHTDFDKFRHYLTKHWDRTLENENRTYAYLTGANFAIRKKTFGSIYGFYPNMEHAEDFEFAYRASKSNIRVLYNPLARAWHDNHCTCSTYIRKRIEYLAGYELVAGKHPELKGKIAAYYPGALKRLVFSFVSRMAFVKAIDAEFFKDKLPASARFKLYDIVITGITKVYPERYRND